MGGTKAGKMEPKPVKWNHLSGSIRLGGFRGKEQWWHLLMVSEFVEAVYELVSNDD